ncbi:hypothetical protein Avbf_05627 [Armadillidium vulgare]|nr:hypothetical protein Avbf_05627 [Armadillidium vulgare]
MDSQIDIKVEAEYLTSEDYSNKQESNDNQDFQEHFFENSEVSHSSSNNLNNNEGLYLHFKQEEQNVPIKEEELVYVNQSNIFDPQDEHMDLDSANSFLWGSNLKKEREKSIVTQDEFMGEPQFNEIQKLNYPSVFQRDFSDTREEILKQYQNEDYMKMLRQKRLEFHSQIHSKVPKFSSDTGTFKGHLITHLGQSTSESESVPSPFKKRSTQSDIIVIDDSSDEEHSEMVDIEEEEISDNDQPHRNMMFKCQLCSYSTMKNDDFIAHCLSHVTGKLFQCDRCNFKTNYEPTIKRHKLQCLKKTEKSVGKRSIPANENKNLNNHLSLSEVINIICNKDTATVGILKCLECTFETKNLKFFNLHLQIHAEVKKCTECIFESKEAETFKEHLVRHFIPQSCMKVSSKSYDKTAKGNHEDSNIENGNVKLNHSASESNDFNPPTDFKKSVQVPIL